MIFTCVTKGESRSRRAVTPSVRPSVGPSIPKSCHRNSSETTDPIIMKLGIEHPCVKGIQVCSNERPRPFPRGDNYEIGKIH